MWEGELHFRAMTDSLPLMLWVAGADGRCTWFNQRWLGYTGRKLEVELSQNWTRNVHPADLPACSAAYTAAFSHRREFQAECRLRRFDGDYRWMLAQAAPRFLPDGAFAGYVGTCTDISEIRLHTGRALSHQRLETLGMLAGGIAHDFNNLVGAMIAHAELALADLPPASASGPGVERIRSVAIRASEIVRELMVYVGQEQGTLTPVDLSFLAEEMLGVLNISIARRAVLKTEFAPGLQAVVAETAELRQLIMNLILNAADAVEASGGEIRIATSRATVRAAEFGADVLPGDYVRLEVSDTGRGMAPEVRARIFERNFTTKQIGRGLGLTVVRRIVRRYNGALQCESAPGRGTRFVVLLPSAGVAAMERDSRASAPAPLHAPGLRATLLIVEDEESLRAPVASLLRRRGFQVIEAAEGEAAIQSLRDHRHRVDAVLLDLTLPGMPAAEIVAQVAHIRPDLPILLTSAYASHTAAALLELEPVKGFIRKPYELGELTRRLLELAPDAVHSTAGGRR